MPINPIALGLVSGATYVSRGFSGETKHLADLIAGGIAHRGFSLVDVFSPCVTYNKVNTYDYFRKRVYKLEAEPGYEAADVRGRCSSPSNGATASRSASSTETSSRPTRTASRSCARARSSARS